MSKENSVPMILERLYRRSAAGIKFDLNLTSAILDRIGNPHRCVPCVHVAGTNGKGSVCAMIEAVLRAQGVKTGLYTSPHILQFNERIQVRGKQVSDEELAALFEVVEPADRDVAASPGGRHGTFFEITTILAFEHFRRCGVQLAVLETGMGGRLDATNVVDPLLSIITRIGIEHRVFLGDTLEQIAGEKAGIIKPGRPVVCGAMDPEAREVIRRAAQKRGAPFVAVEDVVSVRRVKQDLHGQKVKIETDQNAYPPVSLPLIGKYQLENIATAVAALECLGDVSTFRFEAEAFRKGLENVRWPGRCQLLSEAPPVLLDVGHNPDAACALADSVRDLAGRHRVGLVLGLLSDKDCAGVMSALASVVSRCWIVPLQTMRAMPVADMRRCATIAGLEVREASLADALNEAKSWATENAGVVCVAGSLFLAGEVFALLGVKDVFGRS